MLKTGPLIFFLLRGGLEAGYLYTARAVEKLRAQVSAAGHVSVWIQTNLFKEGPQYSNAVSVGLPDIHADDREIRAGAAEADLPRGVRVKENRPLMDIVPASEAQMNLFTNFDTARHITFMDTLDSINCKWGRETVRSGRGGLIAYLPSHAGHKTT